MQVFGYLVEEGVPRSSGLQVHVVNFNQDFRALLLGSSKKPESTF